MIWVYLEMIAVAFPVASLVKREKYFLNQDNPDSGHGVWSSAVGLCHYKHHSGLGQGNGATAVACP